MQGGLYGITDVSVFDYWTIIHLASGICLSSYLAVMLSRSDNPRRRTAYFSVGMGIIFLWELFEMVLRLIEYNDPVLAETLKNYLDPGFFGVESILNVASDIAIGATALVAMYFAATGLLYEKPPEKRI